MKRRDFLKTFSFVALASTALMKASGVFNRALAAGEIWAKAGTLGYKEVAPENQVKAGKQCSSCSWYKAAGADGECTLKAMQTAMKAPSVHVKAAGYCNMWKKKA
jgi:anaerobic selenocysteine-containing dehydrogenase